MTVVILFVLGAIIGSFLNVWALRLNSGLTLGGRSSCPSCGHRLSAWELVPVVSYLVLLGRCRVCRSQIPLQYPAVEILTGLVFATVPYLLLPVFCLYIVITIYDWRHKIIPDSLVYPAVALSLGINLFNLSHSFNLLNLLAGPLLFFFFAILWVLSRGRAIGFGDAKLSLSIGLLLGAAGGFSAVILSFWIGAGAGLLLMLMSRLNPLSTLGKKITIKSEIPFAPFMVLGAWLASVFPLDLLHVALF